MRSDLKGAPKLGLYLALFYTAIIVLPFALYHVGLKEWASEVRETAVAIRHG